MLAKLNWPSAAIVIALIVCVCGLALAGPALGVEPDTLRFVLGGSAVFSTLLSWLMKPPGGAS